jgi:GNAT superfamily N-acetyltransferase
VIRLATDADVTALATLRRRWSEEQHGEVDDPEFALRFRDWYQAEIPRRLTWLAEVNGDPVGMVNLVIFERMPRPGRPPGRWGYLGNAFVLRAYRDNGIGGRLVAALLAYADRSGLARVVLSPSPRSVPFYRRLGFGAADMLMARRLDPGAP